LIAALRAAGHNAFRRSGPGQKRALEVLWPVWVVPITGSTGLHYVLSALSNRFFHAVAGAIPFVIAEP